MKDKISVLWRRLKKGDLVALECLYNIYVDNLFSYGMQVSRDKDFIMDCIHDLFLDLFKYRENLTETDNVEFYLIKSLKRKINREYSLKEISFSKDQIIESFVDDNFHYKSYEEVIIYSEISEENKFKIAKALTFLSKRQKLGLSLRFDKEKTYKEIAQIMNVSVQTSRTIIYRAIKKLRDQMLFFVFL